MVRIAQFILLVVNNYYVDIENQGMRTFSVKTLSAL